jgi:hypothetical protein
VKDAVPAQGSSWTDPVDGRPTSGELWCPEGETWVSDSAVVRREGFAPSTVPLLLLLLDGLRRMPCP